MAKKTKMTFTVDKKLADQIRHVIKECSNLTFSGLMAEILPQIIQQAREEGMDVPEFNE